MPKLDVLAFDPGHETGVVEVRNGRLAKSYTFRYERMMDEMLSPRCGWEQFQVWVVEKFVLYPWKSSDMAFDDMVSSRLIGALDLTARRYQVETVMQTASAAKGLIKDSRLEAYGWRTSSRHEKDAARHAMYYLLERRRKCPR